MVFKTNYRYNADQKYFRMLQREHSAILLTFIKLPAVIKTFVLSIFEWPFYTGFTVALMNSWTCTYIWASTLQNLSSGFPTKARLKSVSSATETSYKIEISPVTNLDMILSNKCLTKALISLQGFTNKASFLASRPIL